MTTDYITPNEFKRRLNVLATELPLVHTLLTDKKCMAKGGFQTWPKHLKEDAYRRMGVERVYDEVSGITNFLDTK